jgi:molybdate transport system ATP-binding protein
VTLAARIRKRLSSAFGVDVDLAIPAGITILFGASGSGKTTVLRSIAGLVRPDSGRITIDDAILFDSARGVDVRVPERSVGYVAQQPALFPHLTIEQNVEYGLSTAGSDERTRRVSAILDSFRIAPLRRRRPREISGGEQQRVALARALVIHPRALLLDEPLSALDYATQTHIMDDLRAWIRQRSIPVLYVTHAHREVFALGERVIALDGGRVQAQGTPHDVLDVPVRHSIATIAGFENVFEATVLSSRADWGTMLCRIERTSTDVEVPFSGAEPAESVRLAVRAGDILVAAEEPRGLSARNVLPGVVSTMSRQGPTVVARVIAGPSFSVHLTPGAAESLALAEGRHVWLIIKTYSWRVVV